VRDNKGIQKPASLQYLAYSVRKFERSHYR
jgi:hypothetical protein